MTDTDALPAKLSPSRVKDFLQCPRLFYYKAILHMSTPPTEATARGTLAHYAFEHVFNHPVEERTPETAVAYVRPAWKMMLEPFRALEEVAAGTFEARLRDAEKAWAHLHEEGTSAHGRAKSTADSYVALLADGTIADEESFLAGTEEIVRAWFGMENPQKFDPVAREKYVIAKVAGAMVHGYIDRFDKLPGKSGERVYVSDYKTGKMPKPRYVDDAFFQLEVYALLLKEMEGETVDQLRLIYVKEGRPDAVLTRDVTPAMLNKTRAKLSSVWQSMQKSAKSGEWPTRKQVLCDWCYFQDICPEFHPELVDVEISSRGDAAV